MSENNNKTIGGGLKKVLYTLNTVRRIGPLNASKALSAKNTCKACGLGMGGQKGGMVNELGEFPSVCNKSVQAHSSDIQAAIPEQIFNHPVTELRDLSGRELDRLGRLTTPLIKKHGDACFTPIDWEQAMTHCVRMFRETKPDRSFFYSSGRSSNEAGFIFQLLARTYGTNNVNNCSYYCHQATSVGLSSTIGSGTATVELADLGGADLVFVMGANPASNHPRFIHKLKEVRERGGHVVVINPAKEPGLVKFALPKSPKSLLKGGDEIASHYLQPNIGSDVAVLLGLAKSVIEQGGHAERFIELYTTDQQSYFEQCADTQWQDLEVMTGLDKQQFVNVAKVYCRAKNAIFAWGMGLTHHTNGVENVEYVANLALLRGMVGRPYAGLLPLRGHSNVQGIGTIGVKPVLAEDVFTAIEREFAVSLTRQEGLDTLACLRAANRGEMDTALIMGGNLFAATPDSTFAEAALNKVQNKIFMTTSLNSGHLHGVDGEVIILPVTARDEEWSATTQESMFNYVRLSDGGIKRHATIRPESVILADLLDAVCPQLPIDVQAFKNHHNVRKVISRIVPGMSELKDIDVAKREFHIKGRIKHSPDFNSNSGKAKFQVRPLPLFQIEDKDYPYRLSTIRSEGQFNSIIYEEKDSYRGTNDRWCVLMNSNDIDALGVAVGDQVNVISANGIMPGVSVIAFDLPPGNIMTYYPEGNILTSTDCDPRSKTPAFKNVPVFIELTH